MKARKTTSKIVSIKVPKSYMRLARWCERASKQERDLFCKSLRSRSDNERRRHLSRLRSLAGERRFVALVDAVQIAFAERTVKGAA